MTTQRDPRQHSVQRRSLTARRPKRSTEEVKRLILRAAEEQFAARGYGGATTKDIAKLAGVAEPMIFRAFRSKEKLFEAAVLEPLETFMARYAQDWLLDPAAHGPAEQALREFAGELYDVVRQHRRLFIAAATTDAIGAGAQPAFVQLERVSNAIKDANGLDWDTAVATRAAVSMVLGMAIFGDQLYPSGKQPGRERIVDELTRMLIGAAGLLR